ncbi:hypothetical protein [Calothrix rhizosoleniae]|uniref:hypothetical protein n=1 Tax=Calothrix rhizosoleniae TaxID=888997 RepID=UPI000B49FC50|nr:hypothetical protein [Calothrix rhizosoleniae]
MTVSYPSQALLRQKQEALDFQDLQGLLRLEWKIGNISLFSGFYTRIDQVFILWGLICAGIFITAQFLPISWYQQAIGWSVLTAIATVAMVMLTWFWVNVENLRWLIYSWVGLMCAGVAITDLGIFLGWGAVLMNLCPLWLGVTAIGYLLTAWGVRSRAFLLMTGIHLGGLVLLPYCGGWQFLTTGLIMGISLLVLAELQWDMRPPIDSNFLTPEQKLFNKQQYQLRQIENLNKM